MKTGKITATIPHKITPTEDMSYKKKEKTRKIKGEEEDHFLLLQPRTAFQRSSSLHLPSCPSPSPNEPLKCPVFKHWEDGGRDKGKENLVRTNPTRS